MCIYIYYTYIYIYIYEIPQNKLPKLLNQFRHVYGPQNDPRNNISFLSGLPHYLPRADIVYIECLQKT